MLVRRRKRADVESVKLCAIVLLGALGSVLLTGAWLWVLARTTPPPSGLGVRDGRLAPCPSRPNCVSSQADPGDPVHFLPPIAFAEEPAQLLNRLRQVLRKLPRVAIRHDDGGYLHAEFKSKWFGFIDDVEFLLDPQAKRLHFRSASRAGYSDLGVNRARIEAIRRRLAR